VQGLKSSTAWHKRGHKFVVPLRFEFQLHFVNIVGTKHSGRYEYRITIGAPPIVNAFCSNEVTDHDASYRVMVHTVSDRFCSDCSFILSRRALYRTIFALAGAADRKAKTLQRQGIGGRDGEAGVDQGSLNDRSARHLVYESPYARRGQCRELANTCQQLKRGCGATPVWLQDLVNGVTNSIPTDPISLIHSTAFVFAFDWATVHECPGGRASGASLACCSGHKFLASRLEGVIRCAG
jgi:hypothetical protein